MNRFAKKLRSRELAIALEITPPRTPRSDVLLRRAGVLGDKADAVHVVQRRDRVPSVQACIELNASGHTPIWHLTTRGRSQADLAAEISEASHAGLDLALVVRGDAGIPDAPDTPKLRDLVASLRVDRPEMLVGATVNQYRLDERALGNLRAKLRAGAGFVETQPVFEIAPLEALREQLTHELPRASLVAMLMPLTSEATAEAVRARLGIPMPEPLLGRLRRDREAGGWAAFRELVVELGSRGAVAGLAIMTWQADPAPEFLARLRRELDDALAEIR